MKYLIVLIILGISEVYAQSQAQQWSDYTNQTITPEQEAAAPDFVHQGVRNDYLQSYCKDQKCDQSNVERQGQVLGGEGGAMLEFMISKMYGMMGMIPDFNKKQVMKDSAAGKDTADNVESKTDWCVYIATAYEAVAMGMQMMMQNQISQQVNTGEQSDLQREALYQVANAHKARKKTATYQSVAYGAVTACYIGQIASKKVVMDPKMYIKMGAAAALTTLYITKSSKHKKAYEDIKYIADSLPGGGKCNPYTQRACFCAREDSEKLYPDKYIEFCIPPQMTQGNNINPISCLNKTATSEISVDPNCTCKKNNSCYIPKLTLASPQFPNANLILKHAQQGLNNLGSGNFNQGAFNNYSLQSAAMGKKFLDSKKVKSNPISLNATQKKLADAFKDVLPETLAQLAATSPSGAPPGQTPMSEVPSSFNKLSDENKNKVENAHKTAFQTGGPGFGPKEEDNFTLPISANLLAQEAQNTDQIEILSFTEKALQNADISKTPDTALFEIISHRYRNSAWKKFVD